MPATDNLLRQRLHLPVHFSEAVQALGSSFELQVRCADGALDQRSSGYDRWIANEQYGIKEAVGGGRKSRRRIQE